MKQIDKKEVVAFLKALEESKLIAPNAHKNKKLIDSVSGIMALTKQEYEDFQKDMPSQSVKMFFFEYQDWKETYV
jgi:hypothetical protein